MAHMVQDWTDGQLEKKIPNTQEGFDGERKLYKELKKQLPDDWIVIYDKTLSDGKGENQIDFLVFVPGKGVVNVDAKGGSANKGEGYHLVKGDVYLGDEKKKVFDKARGAISRFSDRVYQLLRIPKTKKLPDGTSVSNPWGAYGALVVFTNKDLNIPHEHESSYMGGTELYKGGMLERRILEQLDKHRDGFEPFSRYMDTILSLWTIDDEGEAVSREFVEKDERSSLMLSLPQREIMVMAEGDAAYEGIVHVMGSAGTGKTILACGLARNFAKKGQKVLYVCFNEFLAKSIRASRENSGFTITNFHKIGDLIGKNLTIWRNGNMDRNATLAQIRQFFSTVKLPKYDVLIVDEAQDLNQMKGQNEIAALLPLLKRQRRIIVFSDKGQSLYSEDWNLDVEALCGPSGKELPKILYTNYRNQQVIFEHFRNYNATNNDDRLFCYFDKGIAEDRKHGVEELLQQLFSGNDDGLKPRDVIIVGTEWDRLPKSGLRTINGKRIHLKQSRNANGSRDDRVLSNWLKEDSDSSFILVTTEKQIKGLEANVVIFIVGAHDQDQQKYVAESRAKYRLYVVEGEG